MTTAAPVSGTSSTLVLDTDRPEVELRPLGRGDAAAVRAVFARMGARSRELRFLTHKPRLTDGEGQALTRVDGRDHGDVASDNFAVLQMVRRTRARWSLVHAGGGVSRFVLALEGVPR